MGDQVEEESFSVFEENWLILQVFLAMQTQWRLVAGMAGAAYQGLEYQALPVVWDSLGIVKKKRPEVFAGLRKMEVAALQVLNK